MPAHTPSFNIIGPGRLGRVLARRMVDSGYQLMGIAGGTHVDEARAFIGAGQTCTLATLPAADLWLLSVPDDAIASIASTLASDSQIRPGNIALHCSGACSSALLAPLATKGALLASLHPVFSFANPERALATFEETHCALEGDAAAIAPLQALVHAIGGRPFSVSREGKAAYHAALVMASNQLVALAALAENVAQYAGLDAALSHALTVALMRQTLNNVDALGAAAALTGPVLRGDVDTVAAHLAALPTAAQAAYRALSQATLELAGERLNANSRVALQQALDAR
ncbi:Rossmann-like and DUF2520 domain-containing protein [Chitinibacteraceae bacterium HSL-7]